MLTSARLSTKNIKPTPVRSQVVSVRINTSRINNSIIPKQQFHQQNFISNKKFSTISSSKFNNNNLSLNKSFTSQIVQKKSFSKNLRTVISQQVKNTNVFVQRWNKNILNIRNYANEVPTTANEKAATGATAGTTATTANTTNQEENEEEGDEQSQQQQRRPVDRVRSLLRFNELTNAHYRFLLGGFFILLTLVGDAYLQNLQEREEAKEKLALDTQPTTTTDNNATTPAVATNTPIKNSEIIRNVRDAIFGLGFGLAYASHIYFSVCFCVGTVLLDNSAWYKRLESSTLSVFYGNNNNQNNQNNNNGSSLFGKILTILGIPFFKVVGQTMACYYTACLVTKAVIADSSTKSN